MANLPFTRIIMYMVAMKCSSCATESSNAGTNTKNLPAKPGNEFVETVTTVISSQSDQSDLSKRKAKFTVNADDAEKLLIDVKQWQAPCSMKERFPIKIKSEWNHETHTVKLSGLIPSITMSLCIYSLKPFKIKAPKSVDTQLKKYKVDPTIEVLD